MKKIKLALSAVLLAGSLAVPAMADRHDGGRYHHGNAYHHGSRGDHCHFERRHHHNVRVCR